MKLNRLFGLVGLLIFLYLLWKSDVAKIYEVLTSVNPLLLLGGILSNIFIIYFYNIRWQLLLKKIGAEVSILNLTKIWFKGVIPAFLSPGRVGELYRAKFVKDLTGIRHAKIISTIMVDKFLDMLVLSMFSILSFIYLVSRFKIDLSIGYLIFFIILVGVALFFITNRKIVKKLTDLMLIFPMPDKMRGFIERNLKEFHLGLNSIKPKALILAFIYTIFNWGFTIFGAYLFALSLNINVNLFYVFIVHPISSLLSILPISVSGIGTRDLTYVLLFGLIGITQEMSIALSILILLFFNLIHILIGAAVYLYEK